MFLEFNHWHWTRVSLDLNSKREQVLLESGQPLPNTYDSKERGNESPSPRRTSPSQMYMKKLKSMIQSPSFNKVGNHQGCPVVDIRKDSYFEIMWQFKDKGSVETHRDEGKLPIYVTLVSHDWTKTYVSRFETTRPQLRMTNTFTTFTNNWKGFKTLNQQFDNHRTLTSTTF